MDSELVIGQTNPELLGEIKTNDYFRKRDAKPTKENSFKAESSSSITFKKLTFFAVKETKICFRR
jgi:hypothetical protein